MELLRHTPGPWHVDKAADGLPIIRSNFGGQVCMFNRNIIQTKHQVEANARLIAAAPDLLEALKLVMPMFDMHDDCTNIDATAKARKVAYAAIAKAEAA